MPLAFLGRVPILLAQAPALCGAAPVPPTAPTQGAAIVQRDHAFVIVPAPAVTLVAEPVSEPVTLKGTRLGSAVSIDAKLLVSDRQTPRGAAR